MFEECAILLYTISNKVCNNGGLVRHDGHRSEGNTDSCHLCLGGWMNKNKELDAGRYVIIKTSISS